MLKKMGILAAFLCLSLFMAGMAFAAAKPVVIKFAHNGNTNPDDPANIACAAFKKMVEERSQGAIKVDLYPAGQLGDGRTTVEGIQMGTIEMCDMDNGVMGRFVTEAMVWDLPYLFRDIDHAHMVLDGPIGKSVQDKFLAVGIRHLAFNDGGFRNFTNSKRPIRTPEDIKGMKIRVMESEVMISTINGFGASAVPMAFTELYAALQQGVVDGQENPMSLIWGQRFYEVQKYLSETEHFYYPRQYIASEVFWKKLTPEQQSLIAKAAVDACAIQRVATDKYNKETKELLRQKGMQINSDVDKEAFAKLARENVYPRFYAKIGGGDEAKGKALLQSIMDTK